jgi:hypothetical protein
LLTRVASAAFESFDAQRLRGNEISRLPAADSSDADR